MKIHYGLIGVNRRHRLFKTKKFVKGKKILEMGCSDGALLSLFPYGKIIGIDIDKNMLKIAKKYGDARLGSATNKNLFSKEKFDTIVCNDTLEHINNEGKVQNEKNISLFSKNVNRLLNKKGRLIISIPLRPFKNHPEYISKTPQFKNFRLIHKSYLMSNIGSFNNEKHMPKLVKKRHLVILLYLMRPFLSGVLLLKGHIKKESVLLVYEKIK